MARSRATVALRFWGTGDPQIMHSPQRRKVMVLSYRIIASRSAFALVVGCLVWPMTGAPAAAQVSADQIINALAPPPATRGLTAPETKPISEKDRAFIKSLRHRTQIGRAHV